MSKTSNKYISVFIPVFNGDKYLAECLEAILHQHLPEGYDLELIVIDSGSKDSSMDILRQYQDRITLLEIPNSEFGHGKTRQRAAEMARGEFILFLSQDATPAHYDWLINMIEPFFASDKIGCVFGRQTPRRDATPTIKREVATAFAGLGAPDSLVLHRSKSLVDNHKINSLNTFFSDVNSAVRRSLLVGKIPFRDLKYAEDQALAEDMQKNGYIKAYTPVGEVWHSNEYDARSYYKRKFDEYIGLQESVKTTFTASRKNLLLGWIRPTIADYKFLLKDPDYGPRTKLKWLLRTPFYNIGGVAGKYYAIKHLNNPEARKKASLEAGRRG
ncbi:MAG TPA: glycosyltransferase family 2 protein [Candidatus Saccharimonadales bacterium]|nr:glycosyltransferase family 2 protein [Candidatus Saccharimonadales bacterium]